MAKALNETEKEFLMFYMEQSWLEMRHLETLRERITFAVITLSAAILGFAIQQRFATETKPFAYCVIGLGLFGCLATRKLFEIHQGAQGRLDTWYEYLSDHCGSDSQVLKLRDAADAKTKAKFPIVSTIKHNYVWSAIHWFIAAAGFLLLIQYP
jgi:hypothetical protein